MTMTMLLIIPCLILLVGASFLLRRAIQGPTVYDRILAVNALGTKTVILVAALGFFGDPAFFLDTAIVYALINFIATLDILRYIEHGRIG